MKVHESEIDIRYYISSVLTITNTYLKEVYDNFPVKTITMGSQIYYLVASFQCKFLEGSLSMIKYI